MDTLHGISATTNGGRETRERSFRVSTAPPPPPAPFWAEVSKQLGSGRSRRAGFWRGALILVLLIPLLIMQPQASAEQCVSEQVGNKVEGYYNLNKDRSPGYGRNWFRVLVAFGERTADQWTHGGDAITPFTAAEAQARVPNWDGWEPVAEALACLETEAQQDSDTQQPADTQPTPVTPATPQSTTVSQATFDLVGSARVGGTLFLRRTKDDAQGNGLIKEVTWVSKDGSDTGLLIQGESGVSFDIPFKYTVWSTNTPPAEVEAVGKSIFAVVRYEDGAGNVEVPITPSVGPITGNYVVSFEKSVYPAYEGTPIEPVLRLSHPYPHGTITVRASTTPLTATGIGLDYTGLILTAVFKPGATRATLSIPTTIDNEEEGRSDFPPAEAFRVDIYENDFPAGLTKAQNHFADPLYGHIYDPGVPFTPHISISGGPAITEGADATFTIKADPAPPSALSVTVNVTGNGDFGATTGVRTITIPTTGTYTLTIPTVDDLKGEADGSITATVQDQEGVYVVSYRRGSARVNVADSNYQKPSSEKTAKECIEASNVRNWGQACGPSDRTVRVQYAHDPDTKHREDDIAFYIHPSPASDETLTVRATWSGYHTGSKDFKITRGEKVFLSVGANDQVEVPLNVTFEVVASRYEMNPADRQHRVMVADNEPTCWDFSENTGNRVNDEFGFTKIMQFSFAKGCPSQGPHLPESTNKPTNANRAIIEVDFGISGCAITNDKDYDETPAQGDIICFIDVPKGKPVGTNTDVFRIEGGLANGFGFHFNAGQDVDMDDEIITFNPTFTFVNSGGGFFETPNSGAPDHWIAYDNDKPNVSHTHSTVYLEWSLANYQVVEGNGPAQPVVRYYWLDDQNRERTGWYQDCNEVGGTRTCEELPLLKLTSTIQVEVSDGTAQVNLDWCVDDGCNGTETSPGIDEIVIPPGLHANTGKVNIANFEDTLLEGNETFTISIVESTLPNGFALRSGDVTTATVTVIDDDTTNQFNCGPTLSEAQCTTVVRVEPVTTQINESHTGTVQLKLTSTRDIPSTTFVFTPTEVQGERIVADPPPTISVTTSLQASVAKTVSLTLPALESDSSDTPDGSIKLTLNANDSVFQKYRNPWQNRVEDNVVIWIRDEQHTEIGLNVPRVNRSDTEWKDEVLDNLFYVTLTESDLKPWQTFEVPILVTGRNGATVSPSDYRIEKHGSNSNAQLIKRADGTYSVRLRGQSNDEAQFNCGIWEPESETTMDTQDGPVTVPVPAVPHRLYKTRAVCLSFHNERLSGRDALDESYDIRISLDESNPRFGGTRNFSFRFEGNDLDRTVVPHRVAPGVVRSIRIVPVDSLTITEPAPKPGIDDGMHTQRGVEHGFDLIIDPGPSAAQGQVSPVTTFQFCLTRDSTASYYHDFRILDAVAHGRSDSGRAFGPESGCTLPLTETVKKTRYYLKVFGDTVVEGDETISIEVRVVRSDTTDNVRSDGEDTNWTVKDGTNTPAP